MSSEEFSLDAFLSDSSVVSVLSRGDESENTSDSREPYFEPDYTGTIDPRIRQLSYSSLLTLHSCPRKFELYRKRTTARTEESTKSTVTFAFGHVVGEGIQNILTGMSQEEVLWRVFLGWHTDLANVDEKSKKSIWTAVIALQNFISLREAGFLKEYELVYYNDKPATELDFSISFPDGFVLRGSVDAVLRHIETGKILVLECKTTGSTTINPATYKNSSQAIGYSVVLDVLYPELSDYSVLYLIYQTTKREFTPIPFPKSYLQRAVWIQELLLDIETIKLYEGVGVYPMHGESCVAYGRDCEYLQTCTLSNNYLFKPARKEDLDSRDYQIKLTLGDLLEAQFRKVEG